MSYERYLIRVWLLDKPGAFARVAGAIGSVGASIVDMEVLEQGGGWAVDEILVDAVASPNSSDKLVAALTLIHDVNIEEVRREPRGAIDSEFVALNTAAAIVDEPDAKGILHALTTNLRASTRADWTAVVFDDDTSTVVDGDAPNIYWMRAFVDGTRESEALSDPQAAPSDTGWAELAQTNGTLLLGRNGRPFRARERAHFQVLARIADSLLIARRI